VTADVGSFEVKASSDPQSWFTALGQLVVYGAHQSPPPRRLLVVPAPLKNSAFPKALKELSVTLITYDAEADPIEFFGLESFENRISKHWLVRRFGSAPYSPDAAGSLAGC